jgi:hypothetical protein
MGNPGPPTVRRRRLYLLLVLLLLLSGAYLWLLTDNCPITQANYNRIPEGMTLEAAVKILGEPGELTPGPPNVARPWKDAIWATKDGGTTIALAIGQNGTVLWKRYSDDTIWNKALRSVGVNAPPKVKVSKVKMAP